MSEANNIEPVSTIKVTIPGRHDDLLENTEQPPNGVLLTLTVSDNETVLEIEILGKIEGWGDL